MATQEEAEIATSTFIENFVQRHWDKGDRTVCYLSALGVQVKRQVPESKLVLSDGLHDFLRQNQIVKVIQYPGIEQKVGAVPLSVPIPEDVKELFLKRNEPTSNAGSSTSYTQIFWDAFIKPINEEPRFVCINIDGNISVSDGEAKSDGERCFEVKTEDLTQKVIGSTIAERVAATYDTIEKWLANNDLNAEMFFLPASPNRDMRKNDRLSKFLDAFDGIPVEDLARIEIPLDILVKLKSAK